MKTKTANITPKGTAALIVLAAIYAIFGVFARYLSNGIGLYEQWYLRLGVAFILGAIVFHKRISWKEFRNLPSKEWQVLLFRTVIGQVIGVGFFTLAAERTQIGVLAIMGALPASSLLGILLMHEKTSWKRALLLALSFFGALIIVINSVHDVASLNIGAIYALLSTFFFGLMLVGRRWHTGALNNQEITVAMLGIASLSAYILSVILYHRLVIPFSHWNTEFSLVVLTAGGLSVASFYLANYGFEHVSAVIAGNILTLEVLFGPLFGWMFYGEILKPRVVIGGIIIVISVMLMNKLAKKEHQSAQIAAAPD